MAQRADKKAREAFWEGLRDDQRKFARRLCQGAEAAMADLSQLVERVPAKAAVRMRSEIAAQAEALAGLETRVSSAAELGMVVVLVEALELKARVEEMEAMLRCMV